MTWKWDQLSGHLLLCNLRSQLRLSGKHAFAGSYKKDTNLLCVKTYSIQLWKTHLCCDLDFYGAVFIFNWCMQDTVATHTLQTQRLTTRFTSTLKDVLKFNKVVQQIYQKYWTIGTIVEFAQELITFQIGHQLFTNTIKSHSSNSVTYLLRW